MFVFVAAALVTVAALIQSPASAADRGPAVDAMRRLDLLTTKRTRTVSELSAARRKLGSLRTQGRADRLELNTDRSNVAVVRAELAAMLVRDYKSSEVDSALFVLSSGSFSDLIDRVETLDRIDRGETDTMAMISADSARLRSVRGQLAQQRLEKAALVNKLSAGKARLDGAIAAQRNLLASLNSQVRSRIDAHQRRNRLANRDGGAISVFWGNVTWYGPGFAGKRTASGEIFDPNKLTAASPWLPFNTMLRVTSTVTGQSVVVRVNDRGPFGEGVLDLSAHAAQVIHLSGWQYCRLAILSEP